MMFRIFRKSIFGQKKVFLNWDHVPAFFKKGRHMVPVPSNLCTANFQLRKKKNKEKKKI